jgi:hypothetical protein
MTTNVPPQLQSPRPLAPSWREAALARSEVISDAWEVTKTYAGRIAEWVLFGCMVMNILEILVTLPSALSNIVLGTQVVMLDVGGFSLASMGEQARQQGDERAARKASVTGNFLIGVTIVTLLLVTIGLLWSAAKQDTDMAEKGLILVRVIMTVIYGHVIHSLRSVTTHRQHATFSEHLTELSARITESERRITERYTELVERTASELSVRFTEHPALTELAHVTETVEMHTRTLTELMALPGLLEQLRQTIGAQVHAVVQQEMQAELTAHTAQYRTPPNTTRPKLSVVEANTEHRTAHLKRTAPKMTKGRSCGAVSAKPRPSATPIFSARRMSRVSPFHPPISARFGKYS